MTGTRDDATTTPAGGGTSPSLAALQEQYFYLDRNFNRLFLATKTDDERDTLRTDYVQARENYWQARNQRFNDDDPMVQDLQQKVATAQRRIERGGQRLDDVAGLLDAITAAVNLGSRLVSLAAT